MKSVQEVVAGRGHHEADAEGMVGLELRPVDDGLVDEGIGAGMIDLSGDNDESFGDWVEGYAGSSYQLRFDGGGLASVAVTPASACGGRGPSCSQHLHYVRQNTIGVGRPSRERRDFYPDRKRCFLKTRHV